MPVLANEFNFKLVFQSLIPPIHTHKDDDDDGIDDIDEGGDDIDHADDDEDDYDDEHDEESENLARQQFSKFGQSSKSKNVLDCLLDKSPIFIELHCDRDDGRSMTTMMTNSV